MAMDTVETVRARPERADGRARGGNAGRGGGLVDAGTARGGAQPGGGGTRRVRAIRGRGVRRGAQRVR